MVQLTSPAGAFAALARPRGALAQRLLIGAGYGVALILAERLAHNSVAASGASAWDLSGGLSLALMTFGGLVYLPAVALAHLAAGLITGGDAGFGDSAAGALGATVGYAIAAYTLRRTDAFKLRNQIDLVRLILAGGLAALAHALPEALAGGAVTLTLTPSPGVSLRNTGLAFAEYWIGHLVGVIMILPLGMVIPALRRWRLSRAQAVEALAQTALLVGALLLVFPPPGSDPYRYFYLLFIPQIWIAVRFGLNGAVIANLGVQLAVILFALLFDQDGETLVNYQFRLQALSLSGLFLGVAVMERRRAEAVTLERQDQLTRVARLSLAGELAAAIAHDLNQPLLATIAFTRAAQNRLAAKGAVDSGVAEAMDGAVQESERAAAIVRSLRRFVGRSEGVRRSVTLEGLLRAALSLAEAEALRTGVRIVRNLDRSLPNVVVDEIQIQQVILNLAQNAMEAMQAAPSTSRTLTLAARAAPGGMVEVQIANTGPAISDQVASQLFAPFVTSKSEGMGLGLAICRGIIEAHGGAIWLAENRSGACAFAFTLPGDQAGVLEGKT